MSRRSFATVFGRVFLSIPHLTWAYSPHRPYLGIFVLQLSPWLYSLSLLQQQPLRYVSYIRHRDQYWMLEQTSLTYSQTPLKSIDWSMFSLTSCLIRTHSYRDSCSAPWDRNVWRPSADWGHSVLVAGMHSTSPPFKLLTE